MGVDTVDRHIMERPPRRTNEPVVTKERAMLMFSQGAFIALCSLAAFSFVRFIEKGGIERARTASFIVLSCKQLFHSFNCRSMTESIFRLGIFNNQKLVLAVIISFLLQMAVVYLPVVQKIFKTEPLNAPDWLLIMAISSFPLWAMEILKLVNRPRRD
jgi:Ca2+-transporting ATPase